MKSILHHIGGAFRRARRQPPRRARRLRLEALEDRLTPATFLELEANNTAAQANLILVPTGDVLTAGYDDWLNLRGAIGSGTDADYFQFTLASRSGVFFDVDSREVGLSGTLNSLLTVFNAAGTTQLGTNDNGYDFDTGWPAVTTASATSGDSSLYLDLNAGTYLVRVSSVGGTTGSYLLRALADTNYGGAVPVFNSLPGAADTLYLDFDGHAATDAWGTYNIAAYDFSGNGGEFTPAERLAIKNVWRTVAEDYSPFNINVSTNYNGSFANGVGFRVVIGNNNGSAVGYPGTLGVAFLSSYAGGSNNNTAFAFASNFNAYTAAGTSGQVVPKALTIGDAASHEFGHALGLRHYSGASQTNAIMYLSDTGLSRLTWITGTSDAGTTQNDMAVISSTTNTFGYRADDHGNTSGAATDLTFAGGVATADGVIAQLTDVDFFRFTAPGAAATVRVDVDDDVNDLDVEVYVYNASGGLLGSSDPAGSFDGLVTLTGLTPGETYYVEVRGDGGPGEAGQYRLTVAANRAPALAPTADRFVTDDITAVTLSATDADGDPITYSATAQSLAYVFDQYYGFTSDGNLSENYGGAGERWFQGAGGQWFFILPSGEVKLWDGTPSAATGASLGNVGASYYVTPALLYDAVSDPHAAVTVSGTTLTIDREDGFVGSVYVTVTASDGQLSSVVNFTAYVSGTPSGNQAPVLAAVADQTVPSSQLTVVVALSATDPNGDPITYSATAQSLAYVLAQQIGTFVYEGGSDNWGGQNEKWFLVGSQWYYLLPDGGLFQWGGSGVTGASVGHVGSSYWASPSLLQSPPANQPYATLSVSGNTLTVTRDAAYVSSLVVTATASDGSLTDSKTFTVTVTG